MQDIAQELLELGLAESEVRIYIALLRGGTHTFSSLIKKTRLSRKALEQAITQLETRGIVSRTQSGKVVSVTAEDPRLLTEFFDDEEKKISSKKEAALKLLEPLRTLNVRSSARPMVHFFVGQEGARQALEDTLKAKEKNLRAFFSMTDLSEFLGTDFFEQYTKRRIAAGLNLHAVRTFERDKRRIKKNKNGKKFLSSTEERREVRFVSEDLAFPMTLFLYDQKLLGIASKEENFSFIIESKELCMMQKKLFDLTWRSLAIRSLPSAMTTK